MMRSKALLWVASASSSSSSSPFLGKLPPLFPLSSCTSSFNFSPFSFLISPLPLLFHSRFYSYRPKHFDFHVNAHVDDDPKSFLKFVRQQSKLGFTDVETPLSHFHHMKSMRPLPSIIDFCMLLSAISTLIRGMLTLGQQKEAQEMLTEMLRNNITPDIQTYSMLIDMYCKDGKVGEARDIFVHMTERGFVPDIITYSALLDGYCLRGEMDEAEKLMDLMVENGCKPDVVTYSSLINGYCKSKKIDKALGLLQEMHFNGLAPNVITYSTLIDALCKDNQLKLAHQFFKEMEAHGLKPDVITWNSLLDGMCRNAQIDKAVATVKEMESTGVVPNIITYSILMDGFCEANRLREAVDIFSFLTAKGLHDVRAYTIMIKGFCKEGLLVKADELLKNMEDNGCFPDECTFNTIIRGFIDGKDISRALELVRLMRIKEFAADNHTISSFVGLLTDPNIDDADKDLLKKFLENACSHSPLVMSTTDFERKIETKGYPHNENAIIINLLLKFLHSFLILAEAALAVAGVRTESETMMRNKALLSLASASSPFLGYLLHLPSFSRCFHADVDFDFDDPKLFLKFVRQQSKLGFSDVETPLSLFDHMKLIRPLPGIIDFNILFSSICKIKPHPPFSTVISLYRQLLFLGLRPNIYSLTILANCYCRLNFVDLGFSVLANIIKLGFQPNIVTFTTLINGFIHSNQFEKAVPLLDKILKLGFQPDMVTYGSLFKGLCSSGDNAGALKLLRNMESYGHFMPDVVIYSTIIDSLCKDQLLPQALRLFKEMKVKGISPNVFTLIRGMCTLGQQKEAQEMLTEMLRNNITPDVNTYSMLIDMYCKEGKVGEARDIFVHMIERGFVPNIITYSALVDGYCLRGEMDEAEKLMDLMVENGCKPDVVTYSSLINGYCKSKKIDKALGLLQEMHFNGLAPDVITYSTLIDALCKDNQLKLAHQFFKEMEAHGLKPDVITWNSLLDGMCKNGQIDEAIATLKEMESSGVAPDIITYRTLMDGFCESNRLREAMDIFSFLTAKGLHDLRAYTIMIKGFCKEGLLAKADELLKNMEDNGCFPDECTFNTIIRGFIDGKDISRALELVRLMRIKEFAADNHTISSFVGLLTNPNIDDADKDLLKKFFEN
ncbi:pentatricopeptide repeat-containing protein At2g17140-like [Chenopodium quinoa]|nr:pentatricopeptide repeat-containing protein At2g17140-like [Chenopodium quinoa]